MIVIRDKLSTAEVLDQELNLYKLGDRCWPNESFCDVSWFDRKTSQFIQFV